MNKKQLFLCALAMLITLGSCSKSDDNNIANPEPQKEAPIANPIAAPVRTQQADLIKEIEVIIDKNDKTTNSKISFTYNPDNTLNTITGLRTALGYDEENIRYEYGVNSMKVYVSKNGEKEEDVYDFVLAPNERKAISMKATLANTEDLDRRYDFKYNELNQLITIDNKSKLNHNIDKFIWTNGNPLTTDNGNFTYDAFNKSEVLNNSNIDLNTIVAGYPNFIDPRYAGIQGFLGVKATNLLQQRESNQRSFEYHYNTNEKGLVSQIIFTMRFKKENTFKTTTFNIKY